LVAYEHHACTETPLLIWPYGTHDFPMAKCSMVCYMIPL
jgi:hypothetical protein